MSTKNPQLRLTRKVKFLSDTQAGGPSATHVVFMRLDEPDRDDCDHDLVHDLLLTSDQKAYVSPLHLTHCMRVWREK